MFQCVSKLLNPLPYSKGFTLSELLISLSVLGLISALTLPSVFNAVNEQRRKAVFKETIQTLTEVSTQMAYEGDDFSEITPFLSQLNLSKGCYSTETDCMTASFASYSDPRGGVMNNGSTFWDMEPVLGGTYGYDSIVIDWNGKAGPNTEGIDILVVARCVNDDPASSFPCLGQMASNQARTGNIAVNSNRPLSISLWEALYK